MKIAPSPPAPPAAVAPPPRPVAIGYRGVSLRFPDGTLALRDVDLDIYEGEILAVVGPSGCGKSTLLNLVSGLLRPTTGTVTFGGVEVDGPNRSVGYVTQRDQLLPWRTVEKNIALPLEFRKVPKQQITERVRAVIRQVGLTGFERSYPAQLSGGMLKRASFARTMSYSPSTYLMDEPFASLDAQLRMVMHDEMLGIWRQAQATVLFITHDLTEAITLADRIIVMSGRPGTTKLEVTVPLARPRSALTAHESPEFGQLLTTLWGALDHPTEG